MDRLERFFADVGWADLRVAQSEVFSLTLRLVRQALQSASEVDPDMIIAELDRVEPVLGPYFVANASTFASLYAAPEAQARTIDDARAIGVSALSVLAGAFSGPLRFIQPEDVKPKDVRAFARQLYATVALLWRDHRPFAERLARNEVEGDRNLREELVYTLSRYGASSDETLIPALQVLYGHAVTYTSTDDRASLALLMASQAEERALSLNALMPFLFHEPSVPVIAIAALEFARLAEPLDNDPLTGVRYLLAQLPQVSDEATKVGILSGLLRLGDRRVTELLGPCWRDLTMRGRQQLTRTIWSCRYAPVIEWVLDWLEDCEGEEFGMVAGAVARMPAEWGEGRIVEITRPFAGTAAPTAQPEVLAAWSTAEFAERLRPRLLRIAANEAPPRLMHDVLQPWGIDHTRRQGVGVWMHCAAPPQPRSLLSLVPSGAACRTQQFPFVPLDDADFLSRSGSILLCWSIFNPNGPTWSCFARLPTEQFGVDLLCYRMLNPFGQASGAIATLHGTDRKSGPLIAEVIGDLFEQNTLGDAGVGPVLLGGGAPDLVLAPWQEPSFSESTLGFFLKSSRMMEFDIHRDVAWIRASYGRPWERASLQRDWAYQHLQPDGFVALPPADSPATRELIVEWFDVISAEEHICGELLRYPEAWHGSIDHASPAVADTAYTFWQLDDFLSRFGFPIFRSMAEAAELNRGGET